MKRMIIMVLLVGLSGSLLGQSAISQFAHLYVVYTHGFSPLNI